MPSPPPPNSRGDGHAEHADFEEAVDHPARDFLILIDLNGGCSVVEIMVKAGEQFIAASGLVRRGNRIGKDQFFANISPEQIFDKAHRRRLGAEQQLGVFDHLPVFVADAF